MSSKTKEKEEDKMWEKSLRDYFVAKKMNRNKNKKKYMLDAEAFHNFRLCSFNVFITFLTFELNLRG